MELVRLEQVKALLKIKEIDTEADETIQEIVADVSAEVESFLDRDILIQTDKEETFDIEPGQYRFSLRAYPITTLTSVWNDYNRSFGSSTLLSASGYTVNKRTGYLTVDRFVLTPGYGVLKAKYTGGMATDTVSFISAYPAVVSAVTMETAYRYQRRFNLGLIAATVQGGSVTLAAKTQFLPAVEAVLWNFKRP